MESKEMLHKKEVAGRFSSAGLSSRDISLGPSQTCPTSNFNNELTLTSPCITHRWQS